MSVKKALKDAPLQNALWQLFDDAVIRVNRITNMASQLLNLHVRWLLKNDLPIPKLDQNYVRQYFYAVSTSPNAAFVNAELLYVRNTFFTFNPIARGHLHMFAIAS
jgi:hypothetical protein